MLRGVGSGGLGLRLGGGLVWGVRVGGSGRLSRGVGGSQQVKYMTQPPTFNCVEVSKRGVTRGVGPQHTSPHLLTPHLSLHLPLPPPQRTFNTSLPYLFPHGSSKHPNTILLSPHFPSCTFSKVTKLPCDEVSVAKLPCGEVTGYRVKRFITGTSIG